MLQHQYFSSFCDRRSKSCLKSLLLKEITRKSPFIISYLFVYFVHLLAACVLSVALLGLCLQGRPGNWFWGQISLTELLSANLRGSLRIAGHTSATHLCFQMHVDAVPAIGSGPSTPCLVSQPLYPFCPHHVDNSRQRGQPGILWRKTWHCQCCDQIVFWEQLECLPCSPAQLSADRMAFPSLWSERN